MARSTASSVGAWMTALALVGCASVGCAADELDCADLTGEPAMVLGTADSAGDFVERADGADIEAECRASGFWLVTTSVRVLGVLPGVDGRFGDPADPLVLVEAYLGAEVVGASSPEGQHVGLAQVGDAAELHAIPVILDGRRCNELPVDLLGQTVVLVAEVTDSCGNRAAAEVEAVVVNDEAF